MITMFILIRVWTISFAGVDDWTAAISFNRVRGRSQCRRRARDTPSPSVGVAARINIIISRLAARNGGCTQPRRRHYYTRARVLRKTRDGVKFKFWKKITVVRVTVETRRVLLRNKRRLWTKNFFYDIES